VVKILSRVTIPWPIPQPGRSAVMKPSVTGAKRRGASDWLVPSGAHAARPRLSHQARLNFDSRKRGTPFSNSILPPSLAVLLSATVLPDGTGQAAKGKSSSLPLLRGVPSTFKAPPWRASILVREESQRSAAAVGPGRFENVRKNILRSRRSVLRTFSWQLAECGCNWEPE
jgi:hypothetical protein